MSYVGNMPADWQQYSAQLQQSSGESDRQPTQQQQQQSQQQQQQVTPTSSGGNLYNLDCANKQQNDGYYTTPTSARMHHHHHHVGGPYAMEATVADDLTSQRQQMPMSSPTSRMPPPSSSTTMTVNSAMGSVSQMIPGPIQPPPSATTSSRQSSYACKGPCCQAGGMAYRWDKMSPFAPNNAYPTAPTASPYSSRYRPDLYAQQQPQPPPPQQPQPTRRYRSSKESSQLPRGYQPQPPPTYPTMPSYNYTEYHHQKYYARTMPAQQNPMMNPAMPDKYMQKQTQYPGMQNGVMLPPNPVATSPYYNHQMARDLPADYPCKPPDHPKDQVPPPMSPIHSTKHMYQKQLQSLAIQRLNLEKHLREYTHVVGYQNYPKYQELVMKHREVVRMQQSIEHQSSLQSAAATAPVPSTIPPINLQFDQNGVLINSSLIPSYNHSVQSSLPGMPNPMSPGAKEATRSHSYDNKAMQAMEHALQQQHHHQPPPHQQPHPQQPPQQPPPAHQHQVQHAMMQPSPEQHHPHYMPPEYHHHPSVHQQHHHHPPVSQSHHPPQHVIDDDVVAIETRQKTSKELADKPGLDVRSFWATWAETEEEDGVNGGLQNVILTEDTPIVVLEYNENLNLTTANGLTAQPICVSVPAASTLEKEATPTTLASSKDQISTANASSPNSQATTTAIPATVNIIHCITSSGESCDEVPTIHIVDTLENEAVVKKIEGALHSLNPADIKSIEDIVNKNNNATTTTTTTKEVSLEFLTAATTSTTTTTTTPAVAAASTTVQQQQKNAEEANAVVASTPSASTAVEATPAPSEKKNETPEKPSTAETTNLTNFVSEDTRNQDDLSLPELPTSECTTTLNTPNQSDNEESSSERVRAINNISPMISFAHSPIKFQKSGDDLHFDFQSSNEATLLKDAAKSNADKETHDKGTTEQPKTQVLPEPENAVSTATNVTETQEEEQQVASVIDSFEFAELSNSSTLPLLGEEPKMPIPPMEENCLTKIIKDTPPITNLRVLDSDDELADKVNDIWMDINLDNALCNSVNKLMEEKQVQTKRKSSLRHFRKNKNGVCSQSGSMDEKSNDEKVPEKVPAREEPKAKERTPRKSLDSAMKSVGLEKPRKRARSVEVDYNSSQDQEDLLKEFKSLKRKRSIGQLQDDIKMLKSSIDELKSNAVSVVENNVCKNGSLPILPDTKIAQPPKRRFSSIFDPETALVKPAGETSPKNCVDSNIKIQLPNVNLQIQDTKETNSSVCSSSSTNEGIKIEINVSRVESQRSSTDNEIVSKSNQQLNISLPPASPASCKIDCRTSITACAEEDVTSRALPAKETVEEKSLVPVKEKLVPNKEDDIIAFENKKLVAKEDDIIAFENKNAEMENSKCLVIENKDNNSLMKKKEIDIENAVKKLEEAKEDCFKNKTFLEGPGCSKDFDFDNFDVEPFDDKSDDYVKDLLGRKSNSNSVGYLNPLFHLDELENLNNVPVYTTKDGKITYSPNPNYTYRALIIEARQREGHALFRDFYGKRSKHSRHKYKREREAISFENCLANEQVDKSDNDEKIEKVVRSTILDRTDNDKSGIRLSPVPSTPPSMVFESSRSMPLLDEETASNSKSSMTRCIVDLQNLKEDILKKLNDQSSVFNVQTNKDKPEDKSEEVPKSKEDNRDDATDKDESKEKKDEVVIDESAVDADCGAVVGSEKDKSENADVSKINDEVQTNVEKVVEASESNDSSSGAKGAEVVEETSNSIEVIGSVKCDEPKENEEVSLDKCENTVDETDAAGDKENSNLETKDEKSRQSIETIEISSDATDANSNGSEEKSSDVPVPSEPEKETDESVESTKSIEEEKRPDDLLLLEPIVLVKPIEEERPADLPVLEPIALVKPKIKTPECSPKNETTTKAVETEVEVKTSKVKTPEDPPSDESLPELTPIVDQPINMPELKRIVKPSELPSPAEKVKESPPEPEPIPKLKAVPTKEETIVPSPQQKPGSPPKSPGLSLPCSIDKSSFSSELCDSFINQEKLHASQGRTIPKLVIRKTDVNPKCFSKSKSIDASAPEEPKSEENVKSPAHPKIPKMIIRNAKSRPTTPSIEEISESSDSESKPLLLRLKRDSEQSEAKIPKMKIKLEEKQPRVVIEDIACETKTVPKMKITNVKSCQPKIIDTEDDSSDSDKRSKAKRSSSSAGPRSKKAKRSPKDEVNLDPNLEDTQFPMENEYRQRNNSSSSSKVPKVIIKRTSPTAEFKCELSKDAIVNSQPKVILNRSWVLDCMAKDLRHMKVVVKVSNNGKEEIKTEEKPASPNELQWRRFISGLKKRRELSRSNSTPDLHQSSPKIKRRRTSDYCIGNIEYSDSDSGTRFTFAKTRSDTKAEVPKTDALDENMNSRSKMDMEEPPPRLETIMEASDSYSSEYLPTELLDRNVDVHEEEVDFESSVIKVDSSDESETTIEILPASPDLSFEKDVANEEQIYSEDAVPMQFEYEVEIGEGTPDPQEVVPLPSSDVGTDKSSSVEEKQILITEQLAIEDASGNTSVGEDAVPPIASDVEVVETTYLSNKSPESSNTPASEVIDNSLSKSMDSSNPTAEVVEISSNDQAVILNDEASSTSTIMNNENANSRMTEDDENSAAGASCSSSDLLVKEVLAAKEMLKKYLGCLTTSSGANEGEKEQPTEGKANDGRSISHSSNFRHSEKRKKLSRIKSRTTDSHSLRTSSSSRHPSSNNHRLANNNASKPTSKHRDTNEVDSSRSHQIKYKSTRASSQTDPLTRAVEENLRHSKTRAKPDDTTTATKKVDNVISRLDEANLKAKALQLSPEMTISSIVRELVFHEKATIRHRRYCMLCERWFPTTLRHRRHLAGYQHRHTELTQRRAIHMLFLIFTGKLCPKLLPPNVVRTDCAPGELTPLQIAVQDFATVFDGIQQVTGKQEEESKK